MQKNATSAPSSFRLDNTVSLVVAAEQVWHVHTVQSRGQNVLVSCCDSCELAAKADRLSAETRK